MLLKNIKLWLLFSIAVLAIPLATLMSCSGEGTVPHPYRGTNVAGGDLVYGLANFTNPTANQDYLFISNQDIDYLAAKKIGFVRLLISWEALQPTLNGPLANNAYSNDLAARVAYATGKGINVLIEPHGGADTNFARYKGNLVGTAAVPNSAFADFWTKMAYQYKSNPRVLYGLSNEPHDMSTMQWFGAAQAAITGIRSTDSTQMIFVPGNGWTGSSNWTNPNIDTASVKVANSTAFLGLVDPVKNLVASVHMYLDPDNGGGTDGVVSATIGVERMTAVTNWAKANGVRVHLSEIAANSNNSLASTAIKNVFDYIQANNTTVIGWSWWAYGPPSWWGNYRFTLCPTSNYTVDNTKMAWLAPYLVQLSTVPPPTPTVVPTVIVDAAPPVCTYTYSAWGECQSSGTQTRTVTSSTPVPCTASTQVISQSCSYVPPVVDSGTILSPFYARRYVYNHGDTWACMYFYVKNTTETNRAWSQMYVNAKDSKLTAFWSIKTNQVLGSTGSVKFAPVDVTWINAKTETKVGGACFDLGPLKQIPTISGIN